jgi:hypothetical protein
MMEIPLSLPLFLPSSLSHSPLPDPVVLLLIPPPLPYSSFLFTCPTLPPLPFPLNQSLIVSISHTPTPPISWCPRPIHYYLSVSISPCTVPYSFLHVHPYSLLLSFLGPPFFTASFCPVFLFPPLWCGH